MIKKLNKYIAESGICSRRKAVEYIVSGSVTVNGKVIQQPYFSVQEHDVVKIGNTTIALEKKYYFLFYKPEGVICSSNDEKNRKTVLSYFSSYNVRLYTIGRLDKDSKGLIIVTNDGDLAQKLSHPSFEITKQYSVILNTLQEKHEQMLLKGITLFDGNIAFDAVTYKTKNNTTKVYVSLHSGKNRIIRRAFFALGYKVISLERIAIDMLQKGTLKAGTHRLLTKTEIKTLKNK